MRPPMPDKDLSLALGFTAVLSWSTVAVAFKLSLRVLSVSQLLALATFFSTLVLAVVLALRGALASALGQLAPHPTHRAPQLPELPVAGPELVVDRLVARRTHHQRCVDRTWIDRDGCVTAVPSTVEARLKTPPAPSLGNHYDRHLSSGGVASIFSRRPGSDLCLDTTGGYQILSTTPSRRLCFVP